MSGFLTTLLLQAAAQRRGAQPLTTLCSRETLPVNITATFICSASANIALLLALLAADCLQAMFAAKISLNLSADCC